MADRETKEEIEHYYQGNPSKPRAVKQYNQPPGPEHPHANVRVGRKEVGPTRADLEAEQRRQKQEKEREFKRNFQIEKDANAARLRGEKRDAKQKQAQYKPHPTFGGAIKERAVSSLTRWWNAPPPKPKPAARRTKKSTPTVRRSRELHVPGQPSGSFGLGGNLLGSGWGPSRSKKKKGGWGGLL